MIKVRSKKSMDVDSFLLKMSQVSSPKVFTSLQKASHCVVAFPIQTPNISSIKRLK
jgi:hypothetical protein